MPPKSTAQKRKATDILARIVKQAQTARIELTPLVLQCDDEEQLLAEALQKDPQKLLSRQIFSPLCPGVLLVVLSQAIHFF